MILDEGCAERGCPMHDERETKGVVFIRKEWVGLTEDEIQNCYGGEIDDFARALLAKSKEKNT